MKKSIILQSLAMMAMFSDSAINFEKDEPRKFLKPKDNKTIIPKGTKEYHFTISGHFYTAQNKWSDLDYIFSCVASNSKNAIKKFNKFNTK